MTNEELRCISAVGSALQEVVRALEPVQPGRRERVLLAACILLGIDVPADLIRVVERECEQCLGTGLDGDGNCPKCRGSGLKRDGR